MNLPKEAKFVHVGLMVEDLDASVKFMSDLLPCGKWSYGEGAYTPEQMITGTTVSFKCAMTSAAGVDYELIQATDTDSYHAKMCKMKNGFHHVAYYFPREKFDEAVEKMKALNYSVVWAGYIDPGHTVHCYYFTPSNGDGIVVELVDSLPPEE